MPANIEVLERLNAYQESVVARFQDSAKPEWNDFVADMSQMLIIIQAEKIKKLKDSQSAENLAKQDCEVIANRFDKMEEVAIYNPQTITDLARSVIAEYLRPDTKVASPSAHPLLLVQRSK